VATVIMALLILWMWGMILSLTHSPTFWLLFCWS
jgi:hypothetical protein